MLSALAWRAGATVLAPGAAVLLRHRAGRGKEVAARLPERRGIDPALRPEGRLLWIHAASVGEATSILPVLDHLAGTHVLVTTGTVTAARVVAERAPGVLHRFVPWDVPRWASRFLDHWRPDAAAFVESELWPNTLAACVRRDIPVVLWNARLSVRSARGWAWAPGLAGRMVGSFRAVHAQSPADAARLAAMGAGNVVADGDLKFAAPVLPADPGAAAALHHAIAGRPAWLAVSTHPGEDELVAEAARRVAAIHPRVLTVVAPRHPGRGEAVARVLGGASRRATGALPNPAEPFHVADTMGELGVLFRVLKVVVMGKTLLPPGGGQNPLEPARLGCALAAGPHFGNFPVASAALGRAGGLATVADAAALAEWAGRMMTDEPARAASGAAAARVATAHGDLPRRLATELLALAGA